MGSTGVMEVELGDCATEESCKFLQSMCVCKIIIRTKSLKGKVVLEIFYLLSLLVSLYYCFTSSIIPGKAQAI